MFKDQINKTTEVYVGDMFMKSKKVEDHIAHLSEMFKLLWKYQMHLNSLKLTFGFESMKFLGFMVNHRGIEANSEKIQAFLEKKSSQKPKELKSLKEKLQH